MKYYNIGELTLSSISLGCMRQNRKSVEEVEVLVKEALELGINCFDHADIYANDKISSEELFGEVLKRNPGLREKMIIQSKCGIMKGQYNFTKEHILAQVDQSLARLQCGYLDILLLHRPDALMDPKEVGEAFKELKDSGKVKYFGVSNMNSYQIELIQKYSESKIMFNQLQFSIAHSGLVDAGINVNMKNPESVDHDSDVLNYCRLNDIMVQAWSILQIDLGSGSFIDSPKYEELNKRLGELAEKYNTTKATIATAWILRHPAGIQAIAGTTSVEHLRELCKATEFELTREEWYYLYLADHKLP